MYNFDFTGPLIFVGVILALIFGAIGWAGSHFAKKTEYVVSEPITPEIRLTTDGKKIDTVYVYKFNP